MSNKYFILISLGINGRGGYGTPQGKIENVVIYTFKKKMLNASCCARFEEYNRIENKPKSLPSWSSQSNHRVFNDQW